MEVVRVFNNELSSLYEVKPPISKAKMTQITKSAIKGIKFYKHIVQSVEKFIQKCRPEYKVPGLYVVDSIVRQSRHQFGADKDVFGPRFVKNITTTFQHLFKCSEEDRPKIIRVLNLWQKNTVFPIDVIQPLLDMGHPNTSNEWPLDAAADTSKDSPVAKSKEESRHKSDSWKGWPQNTEEPVQDNKTYAEMSTKNLEKFNKAEMSNAIKEDEAARAAYKNQTKTEKTPEETVKFNQKLLDFDYGDEDEEEVKNEESHLSAQPNALALSMAQNLLSNPELLRQIQQMTASTMQQSEPVKDISIQSHHPKPDDSETNYSQDMQSSPQLSLIPPTSYQQPMSHTRHLSKSETDKDDRVLPEPPLPSGDLDERSLASVMASHERLLPSMCLPAFQNTGVAPKPPLPDKDDRIIPDATLPPQDLDERSLASVIAPTERAAVPALPYSENSNLLQFQFDKNGIPYQNQPSMPMMEPLSMDTGYPAVMQNEQHLMQNCQADEDERVMYSMPGEPPLPPQDFDERQILLPMEERSRKERSRSRSGSRSRGRGSRRRSRSQSPRRKRSRSRSHSRKNRSRSRERGRIREKERERERERDRRRKGIPPVKKGCVSVCSTTLWLGHVPKSCSEVHISDTFNPFGKILSIDMIPPRGCAYVVMDRRQDANKALLKLKNVKLLGSSIKMAWAPGKGVKGKEYKDYWEVELGVSYVPYEKIKEDPDGLDLLEEGGFIDEDSLPEHLKALRKKPDEEKHSYNVNNKSVSETNTSYSDIQATPNMVPPPIMPPTSVGIPMVLPHLMQPQFGLHLPGMLPPQAMVMQVPMGIPPPAPMLMMQQQSQGILGNQPMPMVGGVPPIVPRTIPPATTALSNLKNAAQAESGLPSSVAPSTTAGDATPTEEEGTNVSSPSVQMSVSGTGPSVPGSASTQPVVSMAQFNPMLGLNASRPMLSVPPPVSTTGTPIPYPPPNMGFNFPPPGMRHPGQAMPPNPPFPWMQKQVGSPFTDADSSHSNTSTPVRPVPPPQPGMPAHMFGNRPPFHDPQSSASNVNSTPMKELHKGRDNEQKPSDVEGSGNRNASPVHHDKMSQEMVISTDDESSMDIEYTRNDMTPGPCYPGLPDFARSPMNMQRMRGPPGPMPPGPRFRGMPYPMRMGGPRGMGGPGMHNRMDMEYSPHHGPRGPRMLMGPHGPRRNEMHPPPPHDGRDWYPRDFEGAPYERDRDRRYRDDWGREPWDVEGDPRRNSRDRGDHDEGRQDDHRESWNRDHSDMPRPRDIDVTNDKGANDKGTNDKATNDKGTNEKITNDKGDSGKPRDKPSNKGKFSKKLLDDLLKLRPKERVGSSQYKKNRNRKDEKEDSNDAQKSDSNIEQSNSEKDLGNEQNAPSKKEKDRESRRRSRWGRTLSEEREIQQQKRNEVELKFQTYEQLHTAQQPLQEKTENIPEQNSAEMSGDQPVQNATEPESLSDIPIVAETSSGIPIVPEPSSDIPVVPEPRSDIPMVPGPSSDIPVVPEPRSDIPVVPEPRSDIPVVPEPRPDIPMVPEPRPDIPMVPEPRPDIPMVPEPHSDIPMVPEPRSDIPMVTEPSSDIPFVPEPSSDIPLEPEPSSAIPTGNTVDTPVQNEDNIPMDIAIERPVQIQDTVTQSDNEMLVQNSSELKVLADSKVPTDLCTDISQSESLNSCNIVDNVSCDTSVTDNNTASSCHGSVNDLNMDTDVMDSAVTNSTSNENSAVADDVITNNSLVSTES